MLNEAEWWYRGKENKIKGVLNLTECVQGGQGGSGWRLQTGTAGEDRKGTGRGVGE